MAIFLGVDTGGTFTDAILLDQAADKVIARAKALTTRADLAIGIGAAIDAVLAEAPYAHGQIAMVSLSTTLATNALVEGQTTRAALVLIGFSEADRKRAGLAEAIHDAPLIAIAGGHTHSGSEAAPLDTDALVAALETLPPGISAIAIAAQFATRNPAHERRARDIIRERLGLPVTCSHELSAGLNGPRRALTALLNARLVSMIARLVEACENHLALRQIAAPLMAVRGDGALVSAAMVRERPIETILSGPAASIAGAAWLTGQRDAIVSDIGGTTTDVCLLRDGRPAIDPDGARVGAFRTMVEAVAMRTHGLGGDSECHVVDGLAGDLRLGPRRVMPLSLAAMQWPEAIHAALDEALARIPAPDEIWHFAIPLAHTPPHGLASRETTLMLRLGHEPRRLSQLIQSRVEAPALQRLVSMGAVILTGVTPTDAAHVLGRQSTFDSDAARKALTLLARKRGGNGERLAADGEAMARRIIDQLTAQSVDCLLETAFAEDGHDWPLPPQGLASHPVTQRALDRAPGLLSLSLSLGLPVIGLGASAGCYYPAIAARLGCEALVPEDAGVANAIGAVVGQVSMRAEASVTAPGPGLFIAHLPDGPRRFAEADDAVTALIEGLSATARSRALEAGVAEAHLQVKREAISANVEGQEMIVEIKITVEASGRPRIATG